MREKKDIKKIMLDGIKEIKIEKIIKKGWKVDKAKIKYLAKNVKQIQKILDYLSEDSRVIKSYVSNDFKKATKNYVLNCKNGVLYVGVGSNSPKGVFDELQKTIIVEYNPQKIDLFKEVKYLRELKFLEHHRRKIMYLDMAYDMFIDINDIQYYKRQKREYECLISHEFKETVYLRTFGRNGSTRIYNKTLEKNGVSDEDIDESSGEIKKKKYIGDCTRYEIRVKPKDDSDFEPFQIDKLIQLHKLSLKANEDIIVTEMKKEKPNDFKNLYMVHIGMLEMLDKNKKNIYIEKYENIKKIAVLENRQEVFGQYNIESLSKTLYCYLDYIIQDKESKILINSLDDIDNPQNFFSDLIVGLDEHVIKNYYIKQGIFLYNFESEK